MSEVVLIVDDDPVQRRLLEAMVQRFGYRSLTADGGDAALALLTGTVGWLRPGGRLLVLGHDVENITSGIGGPQDPAILYGVDRLAPVAALLAVDRLEQVPRRTPEGPALDTLLWGRRPG